MLSPYGERNSIVILNLELVVVLPVRNFAAVLLAATLVTAACGSDNAGTEEGADSDRPTVVVTTNILGDVVANIVGDEMNVMTILPVGVDPRLERDARSRSAGCSSPTASSRCTWARRTW